MFTKSLIIGRDALYIDEFLQCYNCGGFVGGYLSAKIRCALCACVLSEILNPHWYTNKLCE